MAAAWTRAKAMRVGDGMTAIVIVMINVRTTAGVHTMAGMGRAAPEAARSSG